MAEEVTVRMVVGSLSQGGGDDPVTMMGMIAYPDNEANQEMMGTPARAMVTLFLRDHLIEGVQLDTDYDVTFTPVL